VGNTPKSATCSMPGDFGFFFQARSAADACNLACWERRSYRAAIVAKQAVAVSQVVPRLVLLHMVTGQQAAAAVCLIQILGYKPSV